MAVATTEERLSALEQEVAQLRAKIEGERYGVIGRTRPDFLTHFIGKSANSPMFDEVAAAIAEARERERHKAEQIKDDLQAGSFIYSSMR